VNGKIYVIGGYSRSGEYSSYLIGEATYPSTSSWETVDMDSPSEWKNINSRVKRYAYYSIAGVTVVYTNTTSSLAFFLVADV
tara:strand:- start:306 stop:551 length:246 start_codon:yes stop_codon:yes gene_type:complete